MRRGKRVFGPGRPRVRRWLRFQPEVKYFKPQGIPLRDLQQVILLPDEVEALRLKNIEQLDQMACAQQMKISQSTLQRILSSAYKKISEAIVKGKAIKIED
ncbi:MAG: DUF134 domain-containing protein [Candidatus Komeilibacteria bacterium]